VKVVALHELKENTLISQFDLLVFGVKVLSS